MNPLSSSDPPAQVNRWKGVRSADLLIYKRIGVALTGLTVFCVLASPLTGADATKSVDSKSDGLDDRAEVYVDRFTPPNPRLA